MKPLVKIGLWLFGYVSLGVGLLIFFAVVKFLLDVAPEILIAQALGLGLAVLGFWLLGQHNKLSKGRSIWQ